MWKKSSFIGASVAFVALASASLLSSPAEAAAVYCKTAGVPQGCVVRPAAPVGVAHVGYTHVGPVTGVTHVGATRVRW